MKLLYCQRCGDVVALRLESRTCICGASNGHYKEDQLHVVIKGPCVPLGFANGSFHRALLTRPKTRPGAQFMAFVIEQDCPTVGAQESIEIKPRKSP